MIAITDAADWLSSTALLLAHLGLRTCLFDAYTEACV